MNKTIYIKKEDGHLWERARKLSNGQLSIVILEAIKKFIVKAESKICKKCGK